MDNLEKQIWIIYILLGLLTSSGIIIAILEVT